MQRVLQDEFSLKSEFIDYRCDFVEQPFKWSWRRGGVVANNYVNARLNPLFAKFRKSHCKTSAKSYQTWEGISKEVSDYNSVIFGSDQIWNPTIFNGEFNPVFFGLGYPASIDKIAYAASFGGSACVDSKSVSAFGELVSDFKAVSVREDAGADLIASVSEAKPATVLDPTLLLDNYDELMAPVSGLSGDYIVLFGIQFGPELKRVCAQISQETGYDVVVPLTTQTGMAFGVEGEKLFASPGQWLWLIKNAKLVVTNSFHTCVFSVLFSTPFLAVALQRNMAPRNERMLALLETLGLSSRFLENNDAEDVRAVSQANINWEEVRSRLLEVRKKSLDFLESALR
jgi:hypothetical protein